MSSALRILRRGRQQKTQQTPPPARGATVQDCIDYSPASEEDNFKTSSPVRSEEDPYIPPLGSSDGEDSAYSRYSPESDGDVTTVRRKKPSYVGLSCAVSGYSDFIRYSSPELSPPSQIPVSSPPQTLDSVTLVAETMRQINGNSTKDGDHDAVDRAAAASDQGFHSAEKTAQSPSLLGEHSTMATTTMASGRLVQKQIERLYGITNNNNSSKEEEKSSTTYFVRRVVSSSNETSSTLGRSGDSKNNHNNSLEFSPLKVPAVFRLLRPEFREQLKANSCQIAPERTSPVPTHRTFKASSPAKDGNSRPRAYERVVPIRREGEEEERIEEQRKSNEKIIPIVRENGSSPSKERVIPIKLVASHDGDDISACDDSEAVKVQEASSPAPPKEPNGLVDKVIEEDEEGEIFEEEEESFEGPLNPPPLCTILEEENESATGSQISLARQNSHGKGEVQDGHYFIKLIENETFKFEEQICDFEEDLNGSLPDEARDEIHAAVGKARLLMAQKLAQFRGLCDKNIAQNVSDDPFVPTPQDLAGFWDMVHIQVDHIHSLFADLKELRANGWERKKQQLPPKTKSNGPEKSSAGVARKPKASKCTTAPRGAKNSKSNAASARDEARRKMLEEKKRQMRQQQRGQQQDSSSNGLFVQF